LKLLIAVLACESGSSAISVGLIAAGIGTVFGFVCAATDVGKWLVAYATIGRDLYSMAET
jgi:hypothetical protein